MSIVTLVSGGLDSTIMSILTKEENVIQYPLFIDYGQQNKEQEWKSCLFVHKKNDLPTPEYMDLHGFGKLISSGLTNPTLRINEDAFLPNRNLLFLIAGSAYAYTKKANAVAIGLLSEKFRIFPDQTRDFIAHTQEIIKISLGFNVNIVAPLMSFSKKDIQLIADAKGIQGTYSCHLGEITPCGKCISCIEMKGGI